MRQVILITGKQGSGKSTLADNLGKLLLPNNSVRYFKFAGPLYIIHDRIRSLMAEFGASVPPGFEIKDGPLLQFLGTEWGRTRYGENVWVDFLKKMVERTDSPHYPIFFIIDDCRFENELLAFPEAFKIRLGAPEETRKIRCENWRPNTEHPSETGLDHIPDSFFDLVADTTITQPESLAKWVYEKVQERAKVHRNQGNLA